MLPHTLHETYGSFCYVEVLLGVTALSLILRAREIRTYWPLIPLSLWQVAPFLTFLYLQHLGRNRITPLHAYNIYYYVFWSAFMVQAACAVVLTYTVFDSALRPLKGLRGLGHVVYFWAAAMLFILAARVTIVPKINFAEFLRSITVELQRGSALITLSLIVFVFIAIRPLGLSWRNRVFGVGLGLIITSATNMLQANYLTRSRGLYSTYSLVQIATNCTAELIWIYYFLVPEPKRKFILLPTTSPFHRWNRIAEIFGQNPGYVAIGGVAPEDFAASEIEIFHRASAKMNEIEAKDARELASSARVPPAI